MGEVIASTPSPALAAEREIYRDYERERRLQLARILLPILALVQLGVALVSVPALFGAHFSPTARLIFTVNTILVGADAALHALGIWFARRGRVNAATLSTILPAGITVVVPILVWDLAGRTEFDATSPVLAIALGEMVGTFVLIVLAGLLAANRSALLGTTLLMNAFAVFILSEALKSPGAGTALREQALIVLAFPVLVQWAVAGILFAGAGTYLRTLRELGDARVENARAQQLDRLKDEFITHVNHELRSPVMALQGHVELLLLTHETLAPQERSAYLERAKRAGDDLVSLVMSILEVRVAERAATEQIVPQAVPIGEALDAALRLVDPRDARPADGGSTEREMHVHIPPGMAVWAEPVRVRQVLTNLLSNAVKYSPSGTPVEVTARVVATAPLQRGRLATGRRREVPVAAMAEIAVRDHGRGIPPDQVPLLFNRFVRLPRDLASNVPGNGLGLYLCRELATAMGGDIRVESTGVEGEGTTFTLRLPLPPSGQ